MSLVVGVDGGGTRTRAVVLDAEGREVARGEAPGAVVTDRAPERAADAVEAAVRDAAEKGGIELPCAVLWAGLAGAGSEAPRVQVSRALSERGLADRIEVGTDIEAAFHAAFGDQPGVLLIAGTGSIAWARDRSGDLTRVGGWGRHLGDEGSGYWLGAQALRRVTWAEDGRIGATSLRDAVLAQCGVDSARALIPWVERASKSDVAALAPLVCAAADRGDEVASTLLREAVAALLGHVEAAVRAVQNGDAVELVLWGGLLAEGGTLRDRMLASLEEAGHPVSSREIDPPLGAAHLALALV